jgi:hypothetical protein
VRRDSEPVDEAALHPMSLDLLPGSCRCRTAPIIEGVHLVGIGDSVVFVVVAVITAGRAAKAVEYPSPYFARIPACAAS